MTCPQPCRLRMSRARFYHAVAEDPAQDASDVKQVLEAMVAVLARTLRQEGTCKVPKMAAFVAKKKKAAEARAKHMFGKELTVAARPARTELRVRPAKELRDMMAR